MNRASFSRPASAIEALEARIAPAALFTFTDADGNTVTIKTSKGTDAQLALAISPGIVDGSLVATQLLSINFVGDLGPVFKGTDLTIVAGASDEDTTFTKIGFINAAGFDLGKVSVDGELNRIVAGDENSRTAGVGGLTLQTFGKFDVTPGAQAGEFDSQIVGALTALTVRGDMQGASLEVYGSGFAPGSAPTFRDGRIGSIFIGGSLLGTDRDFGGSIRTAGNIGNVTINGGVKGFAAAGMAVTGQDYNAYISAGLKLGSVTVLGNIEGGDGFTSGHVTSGFGIRSLSAKNILGGEGDESGVVGTGGSFGKITIVESVKGGGGEGSGAVLCFFNMTSVAIGVDVVGGDGEDSGWIAAGGKLSSVSIGRDLIGGTGFRSGEVKALGTIGSVTLGRDLVGGTQFESGAINSDRGIGSVLIKGSIFAGSGERSALITTQKASYGEGEAFIAAPIGSVTVRGSIDSGDQNQDLAQGLRGIGGPAGLGSGGILASGNLGAVLVEGDVLGGNGDFSGRIGSTHNITSVTIKGSLVGGGGNSSGIVTASGSLGPVSIGAGLAGGNLEGGGGTFSGAIFSATKIAKVTIGGDVLGGVGVASGVIQTSNQGSSAADIGAIFIAGSLIGGNSGAFSGSIFSDGKIASIVIGDPKAGSENESASGSIIGRSAPGGGSITSADNLGPIKIKFDLQGGSSTNAGRIVSGGKITSLIVGGSIFGGLGAHSTSGDDDGPSQDGQVYAREAVTKVEIGGGLFGGGGDFSAQIRGRSIGSVEVGDSIAGGGGDGSGSVVAYSLDISSVKITGFQDEGSLSGGGLVAGSGQRSGWIAAEGGIGSVEARFVSGFLFARPRISAVDTISSVEIAEGISLGDIFAGYDTNGFAVNGDAQIGTVKIGTSSQSRAGGNMVGTNIVAGALPGGGFGGQNDNVFGTEDDAPITGFQDNPRVFSRIASVIIGGTVLQAPAGQSGPTHFGIVAQNLGSIKVGGTALPIKLGPGNDPLSPPRVVGVAADTTYGEVGTSVPLPI